MASPLTQSLFKPTDFDLFLEEIGFGDLSPQSKLDLIDRLQQGMEYLLVTKIFQQLSTHDQAILVDLMDKAKEKNDHSEVNEFLTEKIPGVETLAEEVVAEAKDQLRVSSNRMKDSIAKHILTLAKQFAGSPTGTKTQADENNVTVSNPPLSDVSLPQAQETTNDLEVGLDALGTEVQAETGPESLVRGDNESVTTEPSDTATAPPPPPPPPLPEVEVPAQATTPSQEPSATEANDQASSENSFNLTSAPSANPTPAAIDDELKSLP